MGIMCVASTTLYPFSKGCKLAYLVFHRKRLEPKVLPWQQHRRCLSVSFVMHIFGAKFEEHCSNISREWYSWFSVLLFKWNHLWRHQFSHLHNTKTWISLERKKIFQEGKHHPSLLYNYFLLHRHFKENAQGVVSLI